MSKKEDVNEKCYLCKNSCKQSSKVYVEWCPQFENNSLSNVNPFTDKNWSKKLHTQK